MKTTFSLQQVLLLYVLFVLMSIFNGFSNTTSTQSPKKKIRTENVAGHITKDSLLTTYRNLALHKAAYHSSCLNYDNTAHLATDGSFVTHGIPIFSAQYFYSQAGEEIDNLFDGSANTKFLSFHSTGWIQYDFQDEAAFIINKYAITSADDNEQRDPKSWIFQGSNDGTTWINLDEKTEVLFSKRKQTRVFTVANTTAYKTYRLCITSNNGSAELQLAEIDLFEGDVSRIGPSELSSEWRSKSAGEQWIYVDLGAISTTNEVKLYWGAAYAKSYTIEVSTDKINWQTVYTTSTGNGEVDSIPLTSISARYVKLKTTTSALPSGYSLIEFEIYGTGGTIPKAELQPAQLDDGRLYLTGGNWKLLRGDNTNFTGNQISQPEFNDRSWLTAKVPGTILTSYLENGAIPDPNYGDQQLQISDAYFTADFWYRNTFYIPENYLGKKIWLNFDGINWKADLFVNGKSLGKIDGAFIRGKFDITPFVTPGKIASLSVYIHKNDNPGRVTVQDLSGAGDNGGVLGADNPTIHAGIGWDWVPTIRGRNIGIQDNVFLSSSNEVTIVDPFIITDLPLPDTTTAAITVKVAIQNNSEIAVKGKLTGIVSPYNIAFSQEVSLNALETKTIVLDKKSFPKLLLKKPKLWWPNGYGAQAMNTLALSFTIDGKLSDSKKIPFGIREITADTTGGALTIKVNGKRIFLRGGNWGLSESMLRLDSEGYDIRLRLHKEENFTMIRNWVGMTGDEHFYNACDKYGIMIWDDFWLANPVDGPEPNDPKMFMENVQDKIKRFRNHPSIALYCARNEGNPPKSLAEDLVVATTTLDGTRPYIPHSAKGLVTGFGPYSVKDPIWYFQNRAGQKLHSEMGMPNIPSVESMKAMMPSDKLWPINDMWGIHDFCNSAQFGVSYTFNINNSYGKATGINDYCMKAQMVNMENHKAMFEPYVGAKGNGLLMWMSQSAWPSTVWQTYDYYLEQTAGYYGSKKACEPLHIMWDCNTNVVKVSNNTGKHYTNLTAVAKVFNMDGSLMYSDSIKVTVDIDQVVSCFKINFPANLSETHFIQLKLKNGNNQLSDNFYWRGNSYQNYTALAALKSVDLKGIFYKTIKGNTNIFKAKITNSSSDVALMIRLKLLKNPSNERVLPTYYSDNYFSLLPNETKNVTLEFDSKFLGNEKPKLMVEGWNINPFEVKEIREDVSKQLIVK